MRTGSKNTLIALSASTIAVIGIAGCSIFHPSTLTPTGVIVRTHAKPINTGYDGDWDPHAVQVTLDRVEDTTPVSTDQVYVATVTDKNGTPLAGRRIEWMIAEGGIGDILEIDESGLSDSRGYKVNNQYAISHTNFFDHVLDRGTDDPSDDIYLQAGQSWCVISSPTEGTTHLTAFAPAIYNWENNRVLATHNWFDVDWDTPKASTDATGTSNTFSTFVYKHSNGDPLPGYIVRYEILNGPSGNFNNGAEQVVEVSTDAAGVATATISQDAPFEGSNDIKITVVRPGNLQCCNPTVKIAQSMTQETWISPKIHLTKSAPVQVQCGEQFIIPITVSNTSMVDAHHVTVNNPLPSGLTYVSSSPAGTFSKGNINWTLGTLAAGSQQTINLTVSASPTGQFGSYAEANADQNVSDRDFAETHVVCPQISLTCNAPARVSACDVINYTITVRNNGTGIAENVQVADNIAQGLTPTNGQKAQSFNVGSLAPGESQTLTIQVQPQSAGSFISTAVATANGGLVAEDSATTVVNQPRLSITKTGPDVRYLGRTAEFDITITNTGDTPAINTTITDSVPTGMSFVSASNQGSFSGGLIHWNISNLAPGESLTVSHKLRATGKGVARSTAYVKSQCADASTSSETNVMGIAAMLVEVKDTDDPIEVGDHQTYEITVTNQGSAALTSLQVVCELPTGQQFVQGAGPTNARNAGQKVTFNQMPTLGPKQQATFRVTVKATDKGDVRFKAWVTSDQSPEPVMETESTFMY